MINIKFPKPKWIEDILKQKDEYHAEYNKRRFKRILDVALKRK
jgi:hypothetical protein